MTLVETAGQVSGGGSIQVGTAGAMALTVAGTHARPNVSLNLSAIGFET
jgi:hypothetical protein